MSISTLQQSAFTQSATFVSQVNDIVKRQALYRNDTLPADPPPGQEYLVEAQRKLLAEVVRNPGGYGFAQAMVAAASWALTYDGWAADPDAAEGTILSAVESLWLLLVGEVVAAAP